MVERVRLRERSGNACRLVREEELGDERVVTEDMLKGKTGNNGMKITADGFKEHYERVSKNRYEEEAAMIEKILVRAKDMNG